MKHIAIFAIIFASLIISSYGQSSTGTSLPSSCGDGVTANTCPSGYTCINRGCVATPCTTTCGAGDQCVYGSCIGLQMAPPCTPVCTSPYICSLTLAGDDSGMCLSPYDICGECTSPRVCVYGTCQTCASCANNTYTAMAATAVWGGNVLVSISATSNGVIADGQWATLTSATNVYMGVVNGAVDQSGLLIQAGTAATVTGSITGVGNTTGIVIQAGSSLTAGSIVVPSKLTTTVAFASISETVQASPYNAWLSLSSLSVTGDLVLAGGGSVSLPKQTNQITVGSGGMVTVAGNVTVMGTLAAMPIYVGYVASQSGDTRFVNFTSSGNIFGASSDTIFVEQGTFQYSGAVIQPTLDVSKTGVARISSSSLKGGLVSLTMGGQLVLSTPSKYVSFSEFSACDARSLIVVNVGYLGYSISSLPDGYSATAARFESVSAAQGDVACWVQLVDNTGATVLLPHYTTEYIDPEDGGRRLLSMTAKSKEERAAEQRDAYRHHAQFSTSGYVVETYGKSTFDYNNKLITFTYSKTVSYTYISGATNVMPAIMSLVAMIVAIVGTRIMA